MLEVCAVASDRKLLEEKWLTTTPAVVIGDYIYIDGGGINNEGIADDWSVDPPARAGEFSENLNISLAWASIPLT